MHPQRSPLGGRGQVSPLAPPWGSGESSAGTFTQHAFIRHLLCAKYSTRHQGSEGSHRWALPLGTYPGGGGELD